MDLVITYPQQWSGALKRRYYHVVQSAFDKGRLFPLLRDIFFITEPEAEAMAGLVSAIQKDHLYLRPVCSTPRQIPTTYLQG